MRHHRAKERNVFLEQLLLKADRVGGDDHLFLRVDRRHDRRDKIGEALADAGAGLDHQMVSLVDGKGDRFGHLELFGPVLVVRQSARDRAVGSKHSGGIVGGHCVQPEPKRSERRRELGG